MLKISIVDDRNDEALDLSTKLEKYFVDHKPSEKYKITSFDDGIKFINSYHKDGYDIIFLDIEMPKIDGLEVAKKIREIDEYVLLVFVTNMSQFAIKAYEVEAYDFVVKPITYEILEVKMDRILKTLAKRQKINKTISLMSKRGSTKIVSISDIYYVEVRGHTLIWHTKDGLYEFTSTLSKAEAELADYGFFRCNNYALVNLRYVSNVSQDSLICGEDTISISRQRKKEFLKALASWLETRGS